uniref:Uncharacterized protein n=1 Tax=Streptomyces sp. NBC_00093 TaxID=2975649 RepID=A0AAU2AH29_9ACTN
MFPGVATLDETGSATTSMLDKLMTVFPDPSALIHRDRLVVRQAPAQ